ncbi:MAG: GAF domain-containing protein, partial [Anaerolineales bacterium]|nr:GAF domain-containing protein [Anaerolineales bacterium]
MKNDSCTFNNLENCIGREKESKKYGAIYKAISELACDAALSLCLEPDGKILLEWATEALAGIIPAKSSCEEWIELVYADDRIGLLNAVETVILGLPGEHKCRCIFDDGEIRWVRILMKPEWDDSDKRVGRILIAAKDITDWSWVLDRMMAVCQLGSELTLLHTQDAIIQRVLETAVAVTRSECVSLGLVDKDAGNYYCRYRICDKKMIQVDKFLPLDGDVSKSLELATIQSKRVQYIPDASQDYRFVPCTTLEPECSVICVPLIFGEKVIGVLSAGKEKANSISFSDKKLLQVVADQTSVALANASLYNEVDCRAKHLDMLYKAAQGMVSTLELEIVLNEVTVKVKKLFMAGGVSVLLYRPESNEFIFSAVSGPATNRLKDKRFPADVGIAGYALKIKEPVVVKNVQEDSRFYRRIDELSGLTTRSVIAVPLLHQESIIGVIEVVNPGAGLCDRLHLETLTGVANSAAVAIKNAELYRNLKKQMEKLHRTQERLVYSEKMAALGRLSASIAHEVNNPLQSMRTYVTLAREGLRDVDSRSRIERYLDIVDEEIERISDIVSQMRVFNRQTREDMRPTDIHGVLDGVLTLATKQLQQSGV